MDTISDEYFFTYQIGRARAKLKQFRRRMQALDPSDYKDGVIAKI
jgi:hypothetical protein